MKNSNVETDLEPGTEELTGVDGYLPPTLVRASAGSGKTYQLTAQKH